MKKWIQFFPWHDFSELRHQFLLSGYLRQFCYVVPRKRDSVAPLFPSSWQRRRRCLITPSTVGLERHLQSHYRGEKIHLRRRFLATFLTIILRVRFSLRNALSFTIWRRIRDSCTLQYTISLTSIPKSNRPSPSVLHFECCFIELKLWIFPYHCWSAI